MGGKKDIVEQALKLITGGGDDVAAGVAKIVKSDPSPAGYIEPGSMRYLYQHPETGSYMEIVTRPKGARSASVIGLEVPEEYRGQGIGKALQGAVLNDFPSLMGQVSSKAAAVNAYKAGRRPIGNPNATIEDVFKMIDEDSSVNLATEKNAGGRTGYQTKGRVIGDVVDAAMRLVMGGAEKAAPKIKAYHVSPNDFDVFKPSEFRGSTFFASTPERAKRGADAGRNEMLMETAAQYDFPPASYKTYEVEIDPTKIKGLHLTPSEIEWFGKLPDRIVGDEALEAATKAGMPHGLTWDDFYDYQPISEGVFEYTKKAAPPSITYEDAYKTGRDVYRRQHPHYAPDADEKASAERMRKSGMGGYMLEDEGGTSLAVSDPEIVRVLRKYALGGRTNYGPGGVIDDIVKMAGRIVSGADEPAKTGIRAYQGSPHDFAAERLVRFPDKTEQYIVGTPDVLPDVPEGAEVIQDFPLGRMRMDKIGTGEGAQAYGHGLYAAEAEDVAQGYRQRLANVDASEADKIGIPPNYWNAFTMFAKQADETQAEAAARDFANWTGLDLTPDLVRAFDNTLKSRGRMYEVNIAADPNTFLDWDKPLSEQPESVLSVARPFFSDGLPATKQYGEIVKGGDLYDMLVQRSGGVMHSPKLDAAGIPSALPGGTKERLGQYLAKQGIPGIKYLDAGSRGAGEGTRNYVVFDDRLISIIRKYGIAGASAMLGYNLMEQLDPKQALAASMADQDYQSSRPQRSMGGNNSISGALNVARGLHGGM